MIDDNINHEYIIRYLRDLLPQKDGIPRDLEQYAKVHDVPISRPESMKLLEVLIRIGRVRSVLEIGCAIGYSAICMVNAGCETVDTIELSGEMAEIAEENIRSAGYEERIRVHRGDAKEILPGLTGHYDLIFMDAAKAQYGEFFPHCMRILKAGGILVSDNVLYQGMTATDELVLHRKRTIVKRLRDYMEMISAHPQLETSVLPVGDGMAISYKKTNEKA